MLPIAEITFSLNLGQFVSLPILLAVVAALIWFKRQLGPLSLEVGEIATNIQAAVDERFKAVTETAATNHAALQTQYTTVLDAVTKLIAEVSALSEHMKEANGNAKDHSDEDIKRFGEIAVQLGNIEGRLGLPPGGGPKQP